MQTRPFGKLGTVSALTLGGGGIGNIWGKTDRAERVATAREAVAAGITLLDVAPSYGDGEAERVIGEAFDGQLPAGVRITTKCRVGNPPARKVAARLEQSLTDSLERLKLERVDIYFLHNMIVPAGEAGDDRKSPRDLVTDEIVPAFEELVASGRIGAWGFTGIGVPDVVIDLLEHGPRPSFVQVIANVLDSPGNLHRFDGPAKPRDIVAAANRNNVPVLGIRAAQAGALTDAIDRPLPDDHPEARDFQRAAPFRGIAQELGRSAAYLAHQYALSMNGVATVVLGVKNRTELRECVAAEAAAPMSAAVRQRIDAAVVHDDR